MPCLITTLAGLALSGSLHAAVCRVSTAGDPTHDGSSWDVADVMTLQAALADSNCDEVWVQHGVYLPTTTGDRSISFVIRPGVSVYGGFMGDETSINSRPLNYKTVLSGDLLGDDTSGYPAGTGVPTDGSNADNSYHVVYINGSSTPVTGTTILDRVVITAGNTSGSGAHGGGLNCDGAAGGQCDPTLKDILFVANHAKLGAGLYANGGGGQSSPTMINVTFLHNTAEWSGGSLYNKGSQGGNASPSLINVTFAGNQAPSGAAIENYAWGGTASPTLTNVTFVNNVATGVGGSSMRSSATNGGTSAPQLTNVIAWDLASGTVISNSGAAQPTFSHSLVRGSGGSAAWNSSFGTDLGGNLDVDPLLGALADNGGVTPTALPGFGSPAINAGTSTCPTPVDQRGAARPVEGACDMGAVEARFAPCKVDGDAVPPGDGASWATAFVNPQYALNDRTCNEIWVASGRYIPDAMSPYFFLLQSRAAMYGGFAGTETQRSQRDPQANLTVLSGDLDENDSGTSTNGGITETPLDINGTNALHVVGIASTEDNPIGPSTVLDGFVISGGDASGGGTYYQNAGGGLVAVEDGADCAPTLNNLRFIGNQALGAANDGQGGGLYLACAATLTNSSFRNNTARQGGAVAVIDPFGPEEPRIEGVIFRGNDAYQGGAVYLRNTNLDIINSTFHGNSSTDSGGAIYNELYGIYGLGSEPFVQNVTFFANHAGKHGGAIYSGGNAVFGAAKPTLQGVILWGNSAAYQGQQVCNDGSQSGLALAFSIVDGGAGGIEGINGGPSSAYGSGPNNSAVDPQLGPLQDNGGPTLTMMPQSPGSAVNKIQCGLAPPTDQRGAARPDLATPVWLPYRCDLGAVEVGSPPDRIFANGFE